LSRDRRPCSPKAWIQGTIATVSTVTSLRCGRATRAAGARDGDPARAANGFGATADTAIAPARIETSAMAAGTAEAAMRDRVSPAAAGDDQTKVAVAPFGRRDAPMASLPGRTPLFGLIIRPVPASPRRAGEAFCSSANAANWT
jgi:hypothetical protein